MKVQYEMIGIGCNTKCPHGKVKFFNVVRVNSSACQECGSFIRRNEHFKFVICSEDDEHANQTTNKG